MNFEKLTLRCITRTDAAVLVARTDLRNARSTWVPMKMFHPDDAAILAALPQHNAGTHPLRLDRNTARAKGLISPPPDGGKNLFGETP
jgi:hypothetical protein